MMNLRKIIGVFACLLAVSTFTLPLSAQDDRGKAELSAAAGKVTIDYGRPLLKGRDPLTWQKDGAYWRMGMNNMTTLNTSADLTVGSTKVSKGTYGLWLLKVAADRYELVLNSETSGMGMNHDKAKDVASVVMKKEQAASTAEKFTIELANSPGGMTFILTWGTTKLSSDIQFAK